MNKGIWFAIGAYGFWGILPIYWKTIENVPAIQILSHRIVWSFIFLLIVLSIKRDVPAFRLAIQSRKTLAVYGFAAALIGVNWLTYIWGVNSGYIIETSLGYFINPLVSVVLGVILLNEDIQGTRSFGHTGWVVTLLLLFTGVVTALPLLFFASAARRLNLSTLGILQYISPTIQFLIGVFLYDEPFTQSRLFGFTIIWCALLIFSLEGIVERRKSAQAAMV
jgi:EamA domain-containing membrane protein RarD